MTTELANLNDPSLSPCSSVTPRQAETDSQLIALWLHGRSEHTQRAYSADVTRFLAFVQKPIHAVTLGDVQAFADSLADATLSVASINRTLAAVKSLIAFGHQLGYLAFDVARPLKLHGSRDQLAERILSESQVRNLISAENNPRNRLMLTLLYVAGLRVSELCGLRWRNLQLRDDGGQINVFGKGAKTRVVLVPPSVWVLLLNSKPITSEIDDPLFRSRKGGHLHSSQVWRVVKKAATHAGIDPSVSCHWLRHSHASHALDRGAPISLVQATLGHASIATTGRYLHARPSDSSANYLEI